MSKAAASGRKHILLAGPTNAGKSALLNALLGQPRAIVSDTPGTTTDPVQKSAELLPYGPVTWVDTGGLFDTTELGKLREAKTRKWLRLADFALLVCDPGAYDPPRFAAMRDLLAENGLPYLIVWTKADLYGGGLSEGGERPEGQRGEGELGGERPSGHRVSVHDPASVEALKAAVCHALATQTEAERGLLDGLPMPEGGGVVLLITPIDQAAPVGRLILPQVRLIRECLDRGLRCHVTTPAQLPDALKDVPRIALAVTDSQVFGPVGRILPDDVPLTSFSILTARQKGDFDALQQGAQAVRALKPGDRVLIAEACTHTTTHEDIGRVKIPQALEKQAGGKLAFDYAAGGDFPDDLDGYRLVVHCGGCMLTGRMFAARQGLAQEAGVPFTNYGLVLALAGGATLKII